MILRFVLITVTTLALAGAFILPATWIACLAGWASVFCLVGYVRQKYSSYIDLLLIGLLSNVIGYYWLPNTITDFGGFSSTVGAAIFLAFCLSQSLQFVFFLSIYNALRKTIGKISICAPLAWCTVEFAFPRIFPWEYGHTQLSFELLIQFSDLVGSVGISWLMFWVAELGLEAIRTKKLKNIGFAALLLVAVLAYGKLKVNHFSNLNVSNHKVSVIQANIPISQKHDPSMFDFNAAKYAALSSELAKDGRLIVWPETVITNWIPTTLEQSTLDSRLPQPDGENQFLIGALTYNNSPKRAESYNSAVAIHKNGLILGYYHKQILMPFGEYVPFANYFPWLLSMAHMEGQFTAGKNIKVFSYSNTLKVAPLICYEDLVPRLSRRATKQGATLLVNITNDAWFGESSAPYAHNAMAAFRAIENRRYLVRSTNSGLTSIIDPLGRMVESLPPFTPGVLNSSVKPIQEMSIYTAYLGEVIWWIVAVISIGLTFYGLRRPKVR